MQTGRPLWTAGAPDLRVRLSQNMPLLLAAFSGTSWITSQCSGIHAPVPGGQSRVRRNRPGRGPRRRALRPGHPHRLAERIESARHQAWRVRLVRLLAGWSLPQGGVYAVYPNARYTSAKVRAFVDFLRA